MIDEKSGSEEAPVTKHRGSVHEYLGMTIDFSTEGKVRFLMLEYIQGMLNEIPEDMNGESATPASKHLFDVNPECKPLDPEIADMFRHHTTAKLLFLCKRARSDIQTAVAFLCTRVKSPDEDGYKKLAKVMSYLRATADMPLTLESDGSTIIQWWADAAYGVHPDLKSHTGGALSLGKGVVYGTFSTEVEHH